MQKQHSNAKISSPKFQQVCCWLALKIKPWCKKKSLYTFISSSQSILRLKWAWVPSQQRTHNSTWVFGLRWLLRFQFHVFPFFFFFFFSFFFFLRVNSNLTWVHYSCTVHALKNIKNGSHGTIHTFKIYFATVLSVFSFQFSISATISSIQTDP